MKSYREGLILLNKLSGVTSFRSLDEIKKKLNTKKVGHTGTLDKFAEGLLLVLVGKYTKLTNFFTLLNKEYIAQIEFGIQTETLDTEGDVIKTGKIPEINAIKKAIKKYTGEIMQVPPIYSAIHISGERVYKRALRGEKVKLTPRKVHIKNISIINYESPVLTIKVNCSSGTYIRALARDIGIASGSCAFVKNLRRTKIGEFNLKDSVLNKDFIPERHITSPAVFINELNDVEKVIIKSKYLDRIVNGAAVQDYFFVHDYTPEGILAIFLENNLVAIVNKKENKYSYLSVLGRPV